MTGDDFDQLACTHANSRRSQVPRSAESADLVCGGSDFKCDGFDATIAFLHDLRPKRE